MYAGSPSTSSSPTVKVCTSRASRHLSISATLALESFPPLSIAPTGSRGQPTLNGVPVKLANLLYVVVGVVHVPGSRAPQGPRIDAASACRSASSSATCPGASLQTPLNRVPGPGTVR